MVCFRHIIINTLHKGDKKDDNDDDDDDNNNNNNNSDQSEQEFNLSSVKNWVPISEKIYHVSITKIICFMPFQEKNFVLILETIWHQWQRSRS